MFPDPIASHSMPLTARLIVSQAYVNVVHKSGSNVAARRREVLAAMVTRGMSSNNRRPGVPQFVRIYHTIGQNETHMHT